MRPTQSPFKPNNLFLQSPEPSKLYWEEGLWNQKVQWVCGLDEAGRGAWAGPVVAAAVVLKPGIQLPEVDDSKKISPKKRELLFDVICESAVSFGIGCVAHEIIDQINILEASHLAMRQAVAKLSIKPDYLLVDGNQGIGMNIPQKLLVKGDSASLSIAAASILAKVTRDRMMNDYEKQFPQFKFSVHKGYGTQLHQDEIEKYGILPCHRKSFAPIRSRTEIT